MMCKNVCGEKQTNIQAALLMNELMFLIKEAEQKCVLK